MLKIAWRNLLRNKRRSLMSLLIIIIGVAVLFLVRGYTSATFEGLEMMSVLQYGHLQIAGADFWDSPEERPVLTREEMDSLQIILKKIPEIDCYTAELGISGILGTEQGSTIVTGIGVEPGNNLNQNYMLQSGANLFPGDWDRVLVGAGIMKKLRLKEEEWVSIMATTLDGAYNAGSLKVSGSVSLGNTDADGFYIFLPISFVQNLLNTDGVEKYIVRLKETGETSSVARRLREEFSASGLNLEVKTWKDLASFYHQVRALYETVFFFLSAVIFILVFFSILEILSMAFFERMNEIGTIRAIGTKRRQVLAMLIEEGLLLGVAGGILGIIAGFASAHLLNGLNITYVPPSMTASVPLYVNAALSNIWAPLSIVIPATALSALYPAVKSSRLNIVEILRHV